jgi:hypothetical protein
MATFNITESTAPPGGTVNFNAAEYTPRSHWDILINGVIVKGGTVGFGGTITGTFVVPSNTPLGLTTVTCRGQVGQSATDTLNVQLPLISLSILSASVPSPSKAADEVEVSALVNNYVNFTGIGRVILKKGGMTGAIIDQSPDVTFPPGSLSGTTGWKNFVLTIPPNTYAASTQFQTVWIEAGRVVNGVYTRTNGRGIGVIFEAGTAPPPPSTAKVELIPNRVKQTESFQLKLSGFDPLEQVEVDFGEPFTAVDMFVDGSGNAIKTYTLEADAPVGNHTVRAEGFESGKVATAQFIIDPKTTTINPANPIFTPSTVPFNGTTSVTLKGWLPNEEVRLSIPGTTTGFILTMDGSGNKTGPITPVTANWPVGTHTVTARGQVSLISRSAQIILQQQTTGQNEVITLDPLPEAFAGKPLTVSGRFTVNGVGGVGYGYNIMLVNIVGVTLVNKLGNTVEDGRFSGDILIPENASTGGNHIEVAISNAVHAKQDITIRAEPVTIKAKDIKLTPSKLPGHAGDTSTVTGVLYVPQWLGFEAAAHGFAALRDPSTKELIADALFVTSDTLTYGAAFAQDFEIIIELQEEVIDAKLAKFELIAGSYDEVSQEIISIDYTKVLTLAIGAVSPLDYINEFINEYKWWIAGGTAGLVGIVIAAKAVSGGGPLGRIMKLTEQKLALDLLKSA